MGVKGAVEALVQRADRGLRSGRIGRDGVAMARFGEHGDQLSKNGKGIDYSNIQGNIQQYGVWPCPREPKPWPVGFFQRCDRSPPGAVSADCRSSVRRETILIIVELDRGRYGDYSCRLCDLPGGHAHTGTMSTADGKTAR